MKYLEPEMEIVEFDKSALTDMGVGPSDSNSGGGGGGGTPFPSTQLSDI